MFERGRGLYYRSTCVYAGKAKRHNDVVVVVVESVTQRERLHPESKTQGPKSYSQQGFHTQPPSTVPRCDEPQRNTTHTVLRAKW